jgi:hypothetical protein
MNIGYITYLNPVRDLSSVEYINTPENLHAVGMQYYNGFQLHTCGMLFSCR